MEGILLFSLTNLSEQRLCHASIKLLSSYSDTLYSIDCTSSEVEEGRGGGSPPVEAFTALRRSRADCGMTGPTPPAPGRQTYSIWMTSWQAFASLNPPLRQHQDLSHSLKWGWWSDVDYEIRFAFICRLLCEHENKHGPAWTKGLVCSFWGNFADLSSGLVSNSCLPNWALWVVYVYLSFFLNDAASAGTRSLPIVLTAASISAVKMLAVNFNIL